MTLVCAGIREETNRNYGDMLATLLEGARDENGAVDTYKGTRAPQARNLSALCNLCTAHADAKELNRMLHHDKREAMGAFVEMFCSRSWVQLREISGAFQDMSKVRRLCVRR